jgi:hypothetical protein
VSEAACLVTVVTHSAASLRGVTSSHTAPSPLLTDPLTAAQQARNVGTGLA